ncbi:hypothetical protein Mgra_00002902, partial [Meloidogyne graminicola]
IYLNNILNRNSRRISINNWRRYCSYFSFWKSFSKKIK